MDNEKFAVALANTNRITARRFNLLKEYFGDYDFRSFYEADKNILLKCGFLKGHVDNFLKIRNSLNPDKEYENYKKSRAKILIYGKKNYPKLLGELYGPPPFLFIFGEIKKCDESAISIVGSRLLSAYGKQATIKIAREVAKSNTTIVSGVATGADTIAHKEALELDKRTIAVLGSGLQKIYPRKNLSLLREIIKKEKGAIVSQFPLNHDPARQNFPIRNRVIVGLSRAVIVTEASKKSGAIITAKIAQNENRDVFAIPGSIFSDKSLGTNLLIRNLNAKLISSVDDIFEDLLIEKIKTSNNTNLTNEEKIFLEILKDDTMHIDKIIKNSNKNSQEAIMILSMMEIKGLVKNLGSMLWVQI